MIKCGATMLTICLVKHDLVCQVTNRVMPNDIESIMTGYHKGQRASENRPHSSIVAIPFRKQQERNERWMQ